MEYIFNKICNKLWELDKILKFVEDNFIIYLKVIKIKENVYLYFNLRTIYYSFFTLLLFFMFYYFQIYLFSLDFLYVYKVYLGVICIYLFFRFFYLWVLGFYNWIFYEEIGQLENAFVFSLKIFNFFINIFLLYFFLELTFDIYLQCNFLFIIDSLFILIVNTYGRLFGYVFVVRRIDNFINYPLILLMFGLLLIYFDNKYTYIYFNYIKVYFQLFDEKFTNFKN